MSQQASATLIGGFTLAGLAIAATAVVLFGAGKWFDPTHDVVLYFEKSAHGLQTGSDARFGGVLIGRVKSISVLVDREQNRKIIPVVVELIDRELQAISAASGAEIDFSTREGVQAAVDEGLRARMVQQSLLTGLLYIEFDMVPDSNGFVFAGPGPLAEVPAVPTIGTEFDELIAGVADGLRKFNEVDLEGLLTDLRETIGSVRDQVEAIQADEISGNLVDITEDLKRFFGGDKLPATLETLDQTLEEIKTLAGSAREGMEPVLEDLAEAMEAANRSMQQFEQAAAALAEVANPRAPVLMRFQNVMQETERAVRVIGELAEDIRRNPNSLLFGRETED